MPRYDDDHRTVIGYHGTGLRAALRIVNRIEDFRRSERDYDWLGRGIYFWEHAPKQALAFAKIRQRQYQKKKVKTPEDIRRGTEPLAVVACMIRFGSCFDLTEAENVEDLEQIFRDYQEYMELAGEPIPENSRKYRRLDCAVFEYAYNTIERSELGVTIDTARGIYVPTDGTKRVWAGSWISKDTHIQLCVRNPACVLGTWLHTPSTLGVNDVRQALQDARLDVEVEDRPSNEEVPGDAQGKKD